VFVEVHIEQGPVLLERAAVGVVTDIAGSIAALSPSRAVGARGNRAMARRMRPPPLRNGARRGDALPPAAGLVGTVASSGTSGAVNVIPGDASSHRIRSASDARRDAAAAG